ncbi:DUF4942 domain-containing protein [Desulfovibrio sp.]|uniref:DUF4942 domain-containing protein n=1 Tax=Desulfovibrio sp. TaxID=885 RepID=UPI0025C6383E|nr:DUF4942 domain-containing protein [Desulfovibrio sp.]
MELIRRATVAELEGHRNKALDLFAQAFDLLEQARRFARDAAPSIQGVCSFDDAARDALAPRYAGYHETERRDRFLTSMRRNVDAGVWTHLLNATELEKLMDKKARDQFREQLRQDPPPATVENCYATMQSLMGDADMIFRRGIAEVFSNLDRRFRSHDGFKIGSRIVLTRVFNEHGSWNHWTRHDDSLRDVERVFSVLDGKQQPDRLAGIIGAVDGRRRLGNPTAYTAETEYFRIKVFLNGNAHLHFKRNDLVREVNKLLGEYYGDVLGASADVAETKPDFNRAVAKNFGFFETPEDVAHRVMEAVGYLKDSTVLEPSGGRGALATRMVQAGAKVTCVEIQAQHVDHLRTQAGYEKVVLGDFFDMTPEALGSFDRVVMNPPFDGQRDIDHVRHAVRFLKPGGKLVAIMSAGVEFRENAKAVAFRTLVERMKGTYRDLPAGSFAESGTMVNTVIVTLKKPL